MRKGKDGDEQQIRRNKKRMHMGGYSIGNSSPKSAIRNNLRASD